jgi:hypothetical protein
MSIFSHFKELYIGNCPKTIYNLREPPVLPDSFEQIMDLEKSAPHLAFKSNEQSVVQKLSELINKQVHEELTGSRSGCKALRNKGFTLLASGWGTIWEHPGLQGWLIKASRSPKKSTWVDGMGGRCNSANYNNLHRILLAERMREEIAKNNWDIFIPDKSLYRSPHAQSSETLHEKYYVLSKKVELLSKDETLEQIGRQPVSEQRRIAIEICDLIKRTGFTDANPTNIVALKNKHGQSKLRIAIIDTEPIGLMQDISDRSGESFSSFKNCVLTGLSKLDESFGEKFLAFKQEIKLAIEELQPGGEKRVKEKRKEALKKEHLWFIVKIIASIVIPLIPLILLCTAIARAYIGELSQTYEMPLNVYPTLFYGEAAAHAFGAYTMS